MFFCCCFLTRLLNALVRPVLARHLARGPRAGHGGRAHGTAHLEAQVVLEGPPVTLAGALPEAGTGRLKGGRASFSKFEKG